MLPAQRARRVHEQTNVFVGVTVDPRRDSATSPSRREGRRLSFSDSADGSRIDVTAKAGTFPGNSPAVPRQLDPYVAAAMVSPRGCSGRRPDISPTRPLEAPLSRGSRRGGSWQLAGQVPAALDGRPRSLAAELADMRAPLEDGDQRAGRAQQSVGCPGRKALPPGTRSPRVPVSSELGGAGTVASGRRASAASNKVEALPAQRRQQALKAINPECRRPRSGALVEDGDGGDRQMQQCPRGA
jgi:hypothetical protein